MLEGFYKFFFIFVSFFHRASKKEADARFYSLFQSRKTIDQSLFTDTNGDPNFLTRT